jgi:hypothetical protein
VCGGSGKFLIKQCPRRVLYDCEVNRFIGYFWHWKETEYAQYPDGRGKIYQPMKMIEALNLCGSVSSKREQAEMEASRKKVSNGRT